jgi:2-amino-4-hydroxy-6-hydroxymethyldihydropteridine diphosphokinase
MNTAIVMLGSNYQKEQNIDLAKDKLSEFFEITDESRLLLTKPIGKKYKNDFLNQALVLLSADSAIETQNHFKHIEDELGRSPLTALIGDIPIDIDLVFWNGEQKRIDYDKYEFVKTCIDELLEKRIEED